MNKASILQIIVSIPLLNMIYNTIMPICPRLITLMRTGTTNLPSIHLHHDVHQSDLVVAYTLLQLARVVNIELVEKDLFNSIYVDTDGETDRK
jgi:hypothetical protein